MKFKVGDKVKILLPGYSSLDDIKIIKTDCYLASDVYKKRNGYRISISGTVSPAIWWDEELELIEPKPFSKSDLKDGMVVEYRNGNRRVVLNGRFMSVSNYDWMPFSSYTEGLCCGDGMDDDCEYDIIKVYTSSCNHIPGYCKDHNLTLIWERKEEPEYTEMTVEEIEKKLGYKVKVIADK